MAKKQKGPRTPVSGDVATNRRARHKFQVLETMEAGIELRGSEVKSLRDGKAQLNEAYAVVNDGEVWLRGAYIPPYLPASDQNHEPDRPRRLLLQKLCRACSLIASPCHRQAVSLVASAVGVQS